MVYKIPFKNSSGLTYIELILAITIVIILTTVIILNTNPAYNRQRSRDQKRLSDLKLIERMITEFRVDNGVYPDLAGVLRTSIDLPPGQTSLSDSRSGWIVADFIEYSTRMPIDPINDATYFYAYIHDDDQFELNARLEALSTEMANDGGNDATVYEIGNNLTLISN